MNTAVFLVLLCLPFGMDAAKSREKREGESYTFGAPPVCLGYPPQTIGIPGYGYLPDPCTRVGDSFGSILNSDTCIPPGKVISCNERDPVDGELWLGRAPFCNTKPTDCTDLGMDHVTSADCDGRDGDCCWSGKKQLCQPNAGTPHNVRVPDENDGSDNAVCQVFSFSTCKRCSGRRKLTLSGDKARCVAPRLRRRAEPTPATSLSVVTYNVYEVPFEVGYAAQKERLCRIPKRLLETLPEVDVIAFQEVFLGGCAPEFGVSLRELLRRNGFRYSTATVGDRPGEGRPYNGGAFIASRWPIKASDTDIFTVVNVQEKDVVFAKGVVYAKIAKKVDGKRMLYHIFNAHFQANRGVENDAVRVKQAEQIARFKESKNIPPEQPVIYAGDFNADHFNSSANVEAMFAESALKAVVPDIVGELVTTWDPTMNGLLAASTHPPEWLDYVVTSNDHLQPSSASQQAIRLLSDDPIYFCIPPGTTLPYYIFIPPNPSQCLAVTDLSDHFPVLGKFEFEI